MRNVLLAAIALVLMGCAEPPAPPSVQSPAVAESPAPKPKALPNPERNAYFGDLHVHTQYSFDAFIFGVRATPDDAYRFAK
ncbi:MAG: DUF3604 domain-containing protein, partial [Gammaproteobacteria bacterium]|nr:DUF3604 domain-containing protein [Gammaproteobacteria bacterium]